jgi:hypothetical protein
MFGVQGAFGNHLGVDRLPDRALAKGFGMKNKHLSPGSIPFVMGSNVVWRWDFQK